MQTNVERELILSAEVLDVNLRYTESGAARRRRSAATGGLQVVPGLDRCSVPEQMVPSLLEKHSSALPMRLPFTSTIWLPCLLSSLASQISKLLQMTFKQNEMSALLITSWQGKTPGMAAGLRYFCSMPSMVTVPFLSNREFSISLASLSYSWPVQYRATSTLTLCFWTLLLQTCFSEFWSHGRE